MTVMFQDKYVFAQLTAFLNRTQFNNYVRKYAFDSTTIPLCLSVFWWAKFRKKKGGVKAHQISSAIIAYCLVAIVQHDLQLKRSTYEVLKILSISLMDKTPLVDLFERTDFNNVKELDCPLYPGLFD